MEVKVRMSILKDIIVEASRYGTSVRALCERAGLGLDELDEGERWVGLEQASAVWDAALTLTGNPRLGLHIGQHGNPYVIGLVGHLMESSPDLKTALIKVCEFNDLFANMFRYEYEVRDDLFWIYFRPAAEWWLRYPHTAVQAIETSMARVLAISKKFTGRQVLPLKVQFNYPAPADTHIYDAVLQTQLEFEAGQNAMVLSLQSMRLPVASHNQDLFQLFSRLAAEQLQSMAYEKGLSTQIQQIILNEMDEQVPAVEEVADRLHISVRTLQRRLKEEGSTYQGLIDETRKKMALSLLRSNRISSITELAYLLGYSDPSVFRRAFRRWTGKSPVAFLGRD